MELTDEDWAAITKIVDEAGRPETEYQEIALHFLRAGMERAAKIAEGMFNDASLNELVHAVKAIRAAASE